MRHLPFIINFCAGAFFLVLGLSGYASPHWFFNQKYDVLMPTPQSATILRVMMGFMGTIGLLWLAASFFCSDQRRLLASTALLTFGLVLSRLGGLILDGSNQYFTYIELSFEVFALIVTLIVFLKTPKTSK